MAAVEYVRPMISPVNIININNEYHATENA